MSMFSRFFGGEKSHPAASEMKSDETRMNDFSRQLLNLRDSVSMYDDSRSPEDGQRQHQLLERINELRKSQGLSEYASFDEFDADQKSVKA